MEWVMTCHPYSEVYANGTKLIKRNTFGMIVESLTVYST